MTTKAAEALERAAQRAAEERLSYRGALTPAETWTLLQDDPRAKLVDVRSREELALVGRIPGAIEIEIKRFPPQRSGKRTHLCSSERTQGVRAVMPGKGSRGPWNKCGGFIAAFMPRKPLEALEGIHARGSAGDGFVIPGVCLPARVGSGATPQGL
ncbi:MAG: hypothetical protein IPH26_12420 [Sterolibacteriaceae bacterium]|uniref:Rhodanese domain-containing protein n=1 Tax=Candidatus Methylophosphatis roskildensis TaxID=2899263 RepID=A0A9D7E6C4_9PROT|nr:hypothetical protein [Candidatus Methylophosphatis roskildensis]